MKLFYVVLILLSAISCNRKKCNSATITQNGTPCSFWGIKVGSNVYPADSIPNNFKKEGTIVCVDYELYSDPRMCVCCGGTRAKITSIRYPDE